MGEVGGTGGTMTGGACLLIHGFGGAPFEMEPLAVALAEAGVEAHVTTLPGHDATLEDFEATCFDDWARHAEECYRDLEARAGRVVVVGLSMGGTLALHLGCRFRPAGVVALAAPVFLYRAVPFVMQDWRLPFVGLLKRVRRRWPVPCRKPEATAVAPWRGYDGVMALPQLHSLIKGMGQVERELPLLVAPLLLMHARGDRTVPVENALHIARRVTSDDVSVRLFGLADRVAGHHLITTHRESRSFVAREVVSFTQRALSQNCKK